jgi:hypothetical protein
VPDRIDIGFNWLFGLGMLLPSIAGGFVLTGLLASLSDTLGWTMLSSWSLVHGMMIVFIWPLLSFVTFLLLLLALHLTRMALIRLRRSSP